MIEFPPGGATVEFPRTTVHDGNSPAAWTDLDLSAVVGANETLVLLSVLNQGGAAAQDYQFRRNGETATVIDKGCSGLDMVANTIAGYVILTTDGNGIIEWISVAGNLSTKVIVEAFAHE